MVEGGGGGGLFPNFFYENKKHPPYESLGITLHPLHP